MQQEYLMFATRSFTHLNFTIPIYKFPITDITKFTFAFLMISILVLLTYLQSPSLTDRIGSLGALLIAYVGLLPIVDQSAPWAQSITLLELFTHGLMVISFLTLIRSFRNRRDDLQDFLDYEVWEDPFFIFSYVLVSIMLTGILLLIVAYYFHWYDDYNKTDEEDVDHNLTVSDFQSPHTLAYFEKLKERDVLNNQEESSRLWWN